MASSSIMPEPSPSAETSAGGRVVVAFAGNAKYVVGGGKLKGIQVRRVADGQQMASMEAEGVTCLHSSEDGRWIAAGTARGELLMWDARTYERVFEHKEPYAINVLELFSDSTQLLSITNRTATIWDIASGKQLQTFDHEFSESVGTAFAAATENSIRVYDSHDGRLLVEIPVRVTSPYFTSFDDHLFVISNNTIKKLEVPTGSTVAEWPVTYSEHSCIALHEEIIAYSAKHGVTFWDTSTHTKSGFIERPLEISSIAFSPDGQFLAICGLDGEVTIQDLKDGLPSCYSAAPCIHIADTALEGCLVDAEASLTDAIPTSRYQGNHAPNRSLVRVLIKRSKVYVADGLWELALNDANKVIELDPSSPWGYERKHAALHKAGDYENAVDAFETMLSKMSQSTHPGIRNLHRHYINPTNTRTVIRRAVQHAIRDSPRVLINTTSGRLLDKSEQVASFESLPVFKKLISSMTTILNHTRIEHDVTQYYRYAMFSHEREDNETLFENVIRVIVYDLKDSPTNDKLKMFCKIVHDAGLHWAWSDTCCINREDDFVFQEALVAMFRWYQGSVLTAVLLRGVRSPSRRGDLIRSIWNTRVWIFPEYHASKVVRFYNEDWTLYRNLDIPNHKESSEILSEMEEATGISTRALMALQPGLDNIREKLYLVSRRETTHIEDEAYSLLGIFSLSLPVVYGDGDQALGRLLAQVLTSSGDASILAWTGRSGSFNSCLPGRIRVFSQLSTSHIPPRMTGAELQTVSASLRKTLNFTSVVKFYDRLSELPAPWFLGKRMKLSCLTFRLGPLD
ncbi:WD40-repeat-containing domain protein [Boletus reticuloceps]|uniref:WD40-repeat-containing domain protein n=1 Tax=Boletus reticuloceps TaxID=495285 RepID=A0A8I2YYV4_9AGAM|nr:WD40-repeat-containing domain protein [Boletus reticuloceps]